MGTHLFSLISQLIEDSLQKIKMIQKGVRLGVDMNILALANVVVILSGKSRLYMSTGYIPPYFI